ncbi:MAG: hypothetical protein KIT79_07060 [Deltaproteobacteria bacterium]|nr:hypothetical protein [Deltaproteobacteria bacterium]
MDDLARTGVELVVTTGAVLIGVLKMLPPLLLRAVETQIGRQPAAQGPEALTPVVASMDGLRSEMGALRHELRDLRETLTEHRMDTAERLTRLESLK